MKLTKPQRALLAHIVERDGAPVSDSYAPATALISKGLAEWERTSFSDFLCPTEAGRAVIATTKGVSDAP